MTTALLIAILVLMVSTALLADAWLSERAKAIRCEAVAEAYREIERRWRKRCEAMTEQNAKRTTAAVLRYLGAE